MKLNFTKMQGAGNDYIYMNCFDQKVPCPNALAVRLSERRNALEDFASFRSEYPGGKYATDFPQTHNPHCL